MRGVLRQARHQSFELIYPRWPDLHNAIFFDARQRVVRAISLLRRRSWEWMPEIFAEIDATTATSEPLVSVIVPCFNHVQFLNRRLESIASQTYRNIEIILLDDASNDGSGDTLRKFDETNQVATQIYINEINTGKPFLQWSRGIEHARGDLIWIAESDDYCAPDFLEKLVPLFRNRGIIIAAGRSEFVSDDGDRIVWSLEDYLPEFGQNFWHKPFTETTHQLVQRCWGARNLIPNASGCIFRRPETHGIHRCEWWQSLRVCGDWLFYLDLARGGMVGYQPEAKNYYRQHASNSSVSQHRQKLYLEEHRYVFEWVSQHFSLGVGALALMKDELKKRRDMIGGKEAGTKDLELLQRAKSASQRKPNILIVTYALVAGGGEIFPLRLANGLRDEDYNITVLNCNQKETQKEILAIVNRNIPVLTLERLQDFGQIIRHFSIDVVHTHHAWVDTTVSELLRDFPQVKHVITSHGMYDYMDDPELRRIGRILKTTVKRATYVSVKNGAPLERLGLHPSQMDHIANATVVEQNIPFDRKSLGIGPTSFVACLVSRAIREKGWEEAILAACILRDKYHSEIDLLLVGDGPMKHALVDRYKHLPFIHFLGFRSDTYSLFAGSDVGILPSYFMGESQPLTLIECLLAGTPYIASALGDIPVMLDSELGIAGSIIPIIDGYCEPEEIALCIRKFINDSSVDGSYRQRAQLAAKKFSWDTMISDYGRVYQEVLAEKVD